MEEENRKGPGIFYAVVGVATLVVAIIGATFAYFSASATGGTGAITGQTADVGSTALSVSTTRYTWDDTGVTNDNLVPAVIDESHLTSGENSVANALSKKCVSDGYTGCHVWKIEVNSAEAIDISSVKLNLSVTANDATQGHANLDNWKYVLFTGTEGTNTLTATGYLSSVATGTTAYGDLNPALNAFELNADATAGSTLGLPAGTSTANPSNAKSKTIYLMVFLKNVEQVQNAYVAGEDEQPAVSTNDTGSYTGTVTLDAGSTGQVKATFSA